MNNVVYVFDGNMFSFTFDYSINDSLYPMMLCEFSFAVNEGGDCVVLKNWFSCDLSVFPNIETVIEYLSINYGFQVDGNIHTVDLTGETDISKIRNRIRDVFFSMNKVSNGGAE